ncbi:vWA domain-containing protein [Streptosporangium carneum]|uniref:VWFA domain-containing protein n=1 Tax=Streptosporangium carneum TaxID=47481 RepID=A0A9W6IBW9_9ACTN|nr:vWA domain-containing protein [Streptosporangium carneum]GLK14864.1 hypothetical protein GCM10017600_82770 [Streptosporangium carneum]
MPEPTDSQPRRLRDQISETARQDRQAFVDALEKLPDWLQVLLFVVVMAGYVLVFLFRVASKVLRAAWAALAVPLRRTVPYLGLLAVSLGAGWWATDDSLPENPCGIRQNLNVTTTQDEEPLLRILAEEFTNDPRVVCPITVTVSAAIGQDEIQRALENGWSPADPGAVYPRRPIVLSPRPDMIILGSSEHARAILEDPAILNADPPRALPADEGSLGRSPVVLAVHNGGSEKDVGAGAAKAPGITEQVRRVKRDYTVVRPFPERSDAARLATFALYRGTDDKEREEVEDDLTPSLGDVPLGSSFELLCAALGHGDRDRGKDLAVIAPLYAVRVITGTAGKRHDPCPSQPRERAFDPLPLSDVPPLDHPLIRVRWPGETDRNRDAAVDEFRDWLRKRLPAKVSGGSFPTDAPSDPSPATKVEQYEAARTSIKVAVMIDVSGSVVRHVGRDGDGMERARRLTSHLAEQLNHHDSMGLWHLPGSPRQAAGKAVGIFSVGDSPPDNLYRALDRLKQVDGGSPIFTAAAEVVEEEGLDAEATLIVITDGDDRPLKSRPIRSAVAAGELSKKLRERKVHLYVLNITAAESVEPDESDRCQALRSLLGSALTGCMPAEDEAASTVITRLIGKLRVRRPA